jgi:hypothetical protein
MTEEQFKNLKLGDVVKIVRALTATQAGFVGTRGKVRRIDYLEDAYGLSVPRSIEIEGLPACFWRPQELELIAVSDPINHKLYSNYKFL